MAATTAFLYLWHRVRAAPTWRHWAWLGLAAVAFRVAVRHSIRNAVLPVAWRAAGA